MFKDKLNELLLRTGITQAQLSRMTGIPKSAICQYCSGRSSPSEERKGAIAEALGVSADYFAADPQEQPEWKIPHQTVADTARMMGVSREVVARGLREGVFPWGYAVPGSGNQWVYWINARRFAEIEMGAQPSLS